ncbi:MAG TPA: dTMP kinase [Candidatus Methylomirabilis sp.]|nr:dTMP kinase [Candidatus Methylomirabilis sp.]
MPGLFVTFEGGEGSGKTTQLKSLLAQLRATGRDVLETRDPGGTPIGKQVRELLLDRENTRMAAMAELFLYEASRAQLVDEVIRPALREGRIVLCDRFTDSTLAYQGHGRGLDRDLILRLNDLATGGLRPDLTLLLDLPPEVGLARAEKRLTHPRSRRDRMEAERLSFHQRVREGYLAIAAADPTRVVLLDASCGILELGALISRRLEPVLPPAALPSDSGARAAG